MVIFDRAQNAVTFLATKSGGTLELDGANVQSENTLLQQFREEVLRGLCDINTVISLRQNLLVGTAKRETQEGMPLLRVLLKLWLKLSLLGGRRLHVIGNRVFAFSSLLRLSSNFFYTFIEHPCGSLINKQTNKQSL